MNNTVTLPQLITRLAKVSGSDINTSRQFVRAFFATIEKALLAGESVEIKNIGTFSRSSDALSGKPGMVLFVPDKSLRDAVNAPFAMFDPIELDDSISDDDLADPDDQPADLPYDAATEPDEEPDEVSADSGSDDDDKTAGQPAKPSPIEATEPVVLELGPAEEEDEEEEPDDEPEPPHISEHGHHVLSYVLIALLIIVLATAGAYFAAVWSVPEFSPEEYHKSLEEQTDAPATPVDFNEIDVNEVPTVAPTATEEQPAQEGTTTATPSAEPEAPVASVAEPRYDTVTSKRFLATMAREYYGHSSFWVFIYQANPGLGDPNRVSAGTRVRIPDRSELPADPQEAKREAERLSREIQSRY